MQLSRRKVLAGAAVGGGLVLAWAVIPRSFPNPIPPAPGEQLFGAWLRIATDGVITIAVPQLEMGQGISTILPQIIAAEMGADWRQVAVEPAPVSGAYANIPLASRWAALWMPFAPSLARPDDSLIARRFAQTTRFTATADGTSLAAYEAECRNAGAAARAMLAQAAAARWGVTPEECDAAGGFITHGRKKLRFGELAEQAASLEPPDLPPLRPSPYSEEPVGASTDEASGYVRLDLPSKVDGSHRFAGDVRLPDMVFASIRHGPLDEAELVSFKPGNARHVRGLVGTVKGKRWLAVAADNWWAAERALDLMKPRFSVARLVDSERIEERLDKAIRTGEAQQIAERGEGLSSAGEKRFARRYDIEPHCHAPIETASATARYGDGRLELWIASQAPEQARIAAARALGISRENVVLYPMPAGGSFDRRLEHDHAIEVALLARELDRPVQLIWSRWQEQLRTRPRQPASVLISAQIARLNDGGITSLKTRIATPAGNLQFGERLFDNTTAWAALDQSKGKADALACEGAMPHYAIPNASVEHVPADIDLPVSRMRGNAHSYTAFAMESLIDEAASEQAREPLSYRIAMLGHDPQMVECLQQVARMANWDGGLGQSGKGIACHWIGEEPRMGRIACIATARQGEGGVRVTQLSAAVDIGRIVNLDIARQQIEGGLIFGLSLALGAGMRYSSGLPTAQRLKALNLPNLADSPKVEVEFIASADPAADPGELGVAVAPPAIANALFSATGLRSRRLPLLSEGV